VKHVLAITRRRSWRNAGGLACLFVIAFATVIMLSDAQVSLPGARHSVPTTIREVPDVTPDPPATINGADSPRKPSSDNADDKQNDWMTLASLALDSPNPVIRLESAHNLGELNDLRSVQVLEQALHDPDHRVRHAAIDALSMQPSLQTQDVLTRAQTHDDPRVRSLAQELLEELRAAALPRIQR
jgi:hypothetical protein